MAGYDGLTTIARPMHVHGVRTPEEYEALQVSQMQRMQAARPDNDLGGVWESAASVDAFIAGGKWMVTCVCGNAPSASPEWNVARCLECGAVHRNIVWPEDAATIEDVLILRKMASQRGWRSPETVDDLKQENIARGIV